jgi:hypothetical protein
MSTQPLIEALTQLHLYLESAIPAPCDFSCRISSLLAPVECYLDPSYPKHLLIQAQDKKSWLVVYIATYAIYQHRIAVELTAYLDRGIVRFLRSPSCLKFYDAYPETSGLTNEEKISSYLAERYSVPFSNLSKGGHYSQRLLFLVSQSINLLEKYTSSDPDLKYILIAWTELLRFINEVLSRSSLSQALPTGDITYALDEVLLCLDDFLAELKSSSKLTWPQLLRWKKLLLFKVNTLILLLARSKEKDLRLHYRRKIVEISLLAVIPGLGCDSAYLRSSFLSLRDQLGLAQAITLDFLFSLLEDIEISLLQGHKDRGKIEKWERAIPAFFTRHRDACFLSSHPLPRITSLE